MKKYQFGRPSQAVQFFNMSRWVDVCLAVVMAGLVLAALLTALWLDADGNPGGVARIVVRVPDP